MGMELDRLDELYRDAILDHRRNPRNQGSLESADITGDAINPFCGDEIHIQIELDSEGRVSDVGFQGEGCSINQATGSMISEAIKGKTLQQIDDLMGLFRKMMQGDSSAEDSLKSEGELQSLVGVREFPVRIKCSLLSLSALDNGISTYRRNLQDG